MPDQDPLDKIHADLIALLGVALSIDKSLRVVRLGMYGIMVAGWLTIGIAAIRWLSR